MICCNCSLDDSDVFFFVVRLNADRAAIAVYGRQVGCISHSHPLIVFDTIIAQIQQYTNMIGPVVEALKFQSLLSRDALVYVMLESLASKKRSAIKSDGTNLAEWLSALSTFIGNMLFFCLVCSKSSEECCTKNTRI